MAILTSDYYPITEILHPILLRLQPYNKLKALAKESGNLSEEEFIVRLITKEDKERHQDEIWINGKCETIRTKCGLKDCFEQKTISQIRQEKELASLKASGLSKLTDLEKKALGL